MDRSNPLERTNLSIRALEFLLDLQDFDASKEELIGTLCVLAEELQPGAVVGGTIIDGRSATFDRGRVSQPASLVFQDGLSQSDWASVYRNLRTGGV